MLIYETIESNGENIKLEIEVIRSRRKSVSLQIDEELNITVRAPYYVSNEEIIRFVKDRREWLSRHFKRMKLRKDERRHVALLTKEELYALAKQALDYIPKRVAYFAPKVGVTYGRVMIRNQRSRWGSCSSKGNLNYNCLLMLAPYDVIDYVVVHELCHRLQMNHSKQFWGEVERVLPEYRSAKKWLKEHGNEIMRRMTG